MPSLRSRDVVWRATLSGGGNTTRSWSCRGHRNVDQRMSQSHREGSSPTFTVSQIMAVTRCSERSRLHGLHVHIADGLEKRTVQLPFISGAYCADTSPEFGLWKSLWRRSDAKAITNTEVQKSFPLPYSLGNLSCCCQTRQQRSKDCPKCRHEFPVKTIRISSEDNEPDLGTKYMERHRIKKCVTKMEMLFAWAWTDEQLLVISGTKVITGEDLIEGQTWTIGVVLLVAVGVILLCCTSIVCYSHLSTEGNETREQEVAKQQSYVNLRSVRAWYRPREREDVDSLIIFWRSVETADDIEHAGFFLLQVDTVLATHYHDEWGSSQVYP